MDSTWRDLQCQFFFVFFLLQPVTPRKYKEHENIPSGVILALSAELLLLRFSMCNVVLGGERQQCKAELFLFVDGFFFFFFFCTYHFYFRRGIK